MPAKSKPVEMTKTDLLSLFQAKAGCYHSQQIATQLWRKLKPFLTEGEESQILIAWDHHHVGLGRDELDYVCDGIAEAWKNGSTWIWAR